MPIEMNLAQLYLDVADNIIVTIDTQGIITEINQKGCEILGYPKEEIIGRKFEDFLPNRMKDEVKLLFREWLSGRVHLEHYENTIVARDGREKIIDWHSILLRDNKGNIVGGLCSGGDITVLREAEVRLKESEKRFRSTLDNMLEACLIIDFEWRYLYANEAAVKLGRRTKEERMGRTMMEVFPGIEKQDTFAHLERCMKNRTPEQYETEFIFPEGYKAWFEVRAEPVPEGILILYVDITQRKELEAQLSRYRQRLEKAVAERTAEFAEANEELTEQIEEHKKVEEGLALRATILDNAREPIFLLNPRGGFVYANDAALKTYGYARDELLNMRLHELLRPQDAPVIDSRLEYVLENSRLDVEAIHVRKDRTLMPVQVRHSLIKSPHGKFIVSVMRDMTGEARLRLLLEQMPGILLVTDAGLKLTLVMGAGLAALGASFEQETGVPLAEYLEKNGFGETVLAAHQRAQAGAPVSFKVENKKLGRAYYGWAAPLVEVSKEFTGTISIMLEK